jgi:hypothetical protein
MTEIEEGKTIDNLPVIYVAKCSKFKRFKGFNKAIGVGVKSVIHSQNQEVGRKKELHFETR